MLTGLMILIFLGNRSTGHLRCLSLSVPLSAMATFIALALGGGTINSMILGGLALAFSRLIDNSVVVLENIFRHMGAGRNAQGGFAEKRAAAKWPCPCSAATLAYTARRSS